MYDIWGGISVTVAGFVVPVGQVYTTAKAADATTKVVVSTVGKAAVKEVAEDAFVSTVSLGTGNVVMDITGDANVSRLFSLGTGLFAGGKTNQALDSLDNVSSTVRRLDNLDNVTDVTKTLDDVTDSTKNIDDITEVNKNTPLLNGPYIKNGKPNGRPTLTGKKKLEFETEVYNNCVDSDGILRDPNTGDIIDWKPGQSRKGVVDFGHKSGYNYNDMFLKYKNQEITLEELKAFQFDPNNYRLETPSANRSHKYE